MDDLVTWLRAQLDEDERVATAARQAAPGAWVSMYRDVHAIDSQAGSTSRVLTADTGVLAVHAARQDPARVLRRVTAQRRILDLHTGAHECSTLVYRQGVPEVDAFSYVLETEHCTTVLLLAAEYADQPGYQPEWRPE
ncbi:hypothetical protein EYA84_02115 [Verrucosispora sp. SN26_14.1]|uniref:DUF6221 family protein n=1 Tax=Verrucosispora sp. SN26_14.1 TaxID=2527879 RepID=UPI0010342CDF|nr:DUF6221 family protein [Verrucosispora sp. SN26_14.1]TBL44259.1 hypothetical protein EYA84_02115 [Verrucosispora sp. SN26_14.1]